MCFALGFESCVPWVDGSQADRDAVRSPWQGQLWDSNAGRAGLRVTPPPPKSLQGGRDPRATLSKAKREGATGHGGQRNPRLWPLALAHSLRTDFPPGICRALLHVAQCQCSAEGPSSRGATCVPMYIHSSLLVSSLTLLLE
jgi:hypothetical protein